MTQNTRTWLHGLMAAAIGTFGSSIGNMLVAPDRFNLTSAQGFLHTVLAALISAVVSVGLYLSKSPLPTLEQVSDQKTTTAPDGTETKVTSIKTTVS